MTALLNRRATQVSALLPLAIVLCLAAGCGDSGSGDFRSYGELEPADRPAGPPQSPEDDSSQSLTATGQPGTTGDRDSTAAAEATSGETAASADTQPFPAEQADRSQPVVAIKPDTAGSATAGLSRRLPVEAPRPGPDSFPVVPVVVREVKLLVPEQTFRTEGPQSAIRVTYDDIDLLKVLNMEPVTANAPELMPEWMKALDGQRVRIRGFMYPPFQETGIEAFALARDNQICCFGKNPKIYDLFPVFLRKGHTTDYILNRPFDVVGVFHIDPITDEDGKPEQLYLIDDAIVIDR